MNDPQMLFVFAVTLLALVAFAREWGSTDGIALLTLAALVVGGALTVREAFQGFGNEALVTVAAMFVLSAGLTRTGALERVGQAIVRWGGTSEPRLVLTLMLTCALSSSFINNTPVAVVFLPVVMGVAARTGVPASRLLLPMSYAVIVGGMTTVLGTSTSVLLAGRLADHRLPPLDLFDPLVLGLAGMAVTVLYMLLVGRHLLPRNPSLTTTVRAGALSDYVTELTVPAGSPLAGKSITDALGPAGRDVRVLQVIRGEEVRAPLPQTVLGEGDTLLVRGGPDALVALHRTEGVQGPAGVEGWVARGRNTSLAELLVRPASSAIGATVRDLELHARHGVVVLALQREGAHIREKVADLQVRLGDLLLVEGDVAALSSFRSSPDFVLLEGVEEQVVLRHRALPAVLVVMAVVVLASLEVAPISLLALGGTLAMVLGGCLTSREAYRAIDLRLLVLMAGTIGLGRALESSGGAAFLAEHITRFARPFGDVGLLSAVYVVCNLLTALVSNAAAALITLPIAIAAATQAGLEVKPFLMAVLFAASVDFSTPIGYQTNTLVYGPGGYRFADYLKVGGPLNLLWWILATALIPLLWPLRA